MNHPAPMRRQASEAGGSSCNGNILCSARKGGRCTAWAQGQAGVAVPRTLSRDDVTFDVRVNSSDRAKFLKGPRLH